MRTNRFSIVLLAAFAATSAAAQQAQPAAAPQPPTLTPGQQLIRAGKLEDALALYQKD
jgi:hypothetical protein